MPRNRRKHDGACDLNPPSDYTLHASQIQDRIKGDETLDAAVDVEVLYRDTAVVEVRITGEITDEAAERVLRSLRARPINAPLRESYALLDPEEKQEEESSTAS